MTSTLGRLLGEASLKLAFLAVNAPAVFGAYRRWTDIPYGPDPRHRLDWYLPERPAARAAPLTRPSTDSPPPGDCSSWDIRPERTSRRS